ncbi:PREDICTED: anaphase-promoting complex subunit 11, partial [Erythranthe guttata]|uniref:anaphase-promoting complex subunit 11 n=1 Tax=Erythranthe guttata TaxID=4155 RepID=UPI00064D971D
LFNSRQQTLASVNGRFSQIDSNIKPYCLREQENEGQDFTWHAIGSWTWDAQDETCGICRMAFDGCCPDCKLPGDDCPLMWGACNHAFHLHCILKWVNSQTSQAHCPMCRREWQYKE